MRVTRILANIVGAMLFVQVILGGGATLLSFPIEFHIIWGILTFAVLVATTVFITRSYGRKSGIFYVSIAAIGDFVLQGVLGLLAFDSDSIVVVHLTNAFVLAVLATYLISMADKPVAAPIATDKNIPATAR